MHFFHDSGVSSVLESSFTPRKLRFSGRCFLALKKKLLFLEVPFSASRYRINKARCFIFYKSDHSTLISTARVRAIPRIKTPTKSLSTSPIRAPLLLNKNGRCRTDIHNCDAQGKRPQRINTPCGPYTHFIFEDFALALNNLAVNRLYQR